MIKLIKFGGVKSHYGLIWSNYFNSFSSKKLLQGMKFLFSIIELSRSLYPKGKILLNL